MPADSQHIIITEWEAEKGMDRVTVVVDVDDEIIEVDEDGNAVTRSYGVPTTDVQYYVYNRTGEQQGTYRVGKFDDEGMPLPAAF